MGREFGYRRVGAFCGLRLFLYGLGYAHQFIYFGHFFWFFRGFGLGREVFVFLLYRLTRTTGSLFGQFRIDRGRFRISSFGVIS